ncbi:hypothetical protein J1N35_028839 [Gossypium stocksii]|uniref:Uncharacterized protein ycf72 n=1 Tax=Gossypium stocksii TaxID=47602 RepID=A0A9D3UX30_9ROSI|nr:hypothetical protein J1N35_028839 [Gossypium stocksii]
MGMVYRFITTPLTIGCLPSQHLHSALPKLFWFTPTFPTCLTIAEQFLDIKQTSPEAFKPNDYEITSILPHIMGNVRDISIFPQGIFRITTV